MTLSREFTGWAHALTLEEIPERVQKRIATHLLDGLGTALAGARAPEASFVLPVVRLLGSGVEATIVGAQERASAPVAAFANGALMHALDFDDTHTRGLVHATAVTVPAALAVGERQGSSGAELFCALAAGYELVGRLAAAAPHGFHAKGFHATSVCGTFSSALVSSLLGRLTSPQVVDALGIAGSQSSGSMEFLSTGASTKQIHPGWASLGGVMAADLAQAGASGPDSILEGARGLYALYTESDPDLGSVVDGLGKTWAVEGVALKPYPACHLIHRSLDAARELTRSVQADDIDELVVTMPADSEAIVCSPEASKRRPRSAYEAKFSVQWSVAAMLIDGKLGLDTYAEERISRDDVLALSQRIRYETESGSAPAAEVPGLVTARLRDGRTVSARSEGGENLSGAGLDELALTKFRSNVGLPEEAVRPLVEEVFKLPSAPALGQFVAELQKVGGLVAQRGPRSTSASVEGVQ